VIAIIGAGHSCEISLARNEKLPDFGPPADGRICRICHG